MSEARISDLQEQLLTLRTRLEQAGNVSGAIRASSALDRLKLAASGFLDAEDVEAAIANAASVIDNDGMPAKKEGRPQ